MAEVPLAGSPQSVSLDVCVGCQFVWFDPREFEQVPRRGREPAPSLPLKAREAAALMELKSFEQRERGSDFGDEAPDEPWKWIPAVLGLPVEHEVNPLRSLPWLTWSLAALMAATFALTWRHLMSIVPEWGLVPAQFWRHGGLTILTSFFLHAGPMHVISNAYFLLVFGDNVEDQLGRWRYGLLVLGAALAGDLLHAWCEPRGTVPCIGASGGISGVIVFYALRFPRARLGLLIRYWYVFRWLYVPAWCALACWLLLQFALAAGQLAGGGAVSALAHLGGAAVGLLAWLGWRASAARRAVLE